MHQAIEFSLFRLVMDVFIDKLGFEPDFYKPGSKLTLLHVLAKYGSSTVWSERRQGDIKRLISKCNNLTLRNNMGSSVLRCMRNVNADDANISLLELWMTEQVNERTKGVTFLLYKVSEKKLKGSLPSRQMIRDVMKYID